VLIVKGLILHVLFVVIDSIYYTSAVLFLFFNSCKFFIEYLPLVTSINVIPVEKFENGIYVGEIGYYPELQPIAPVGHSRVCQKLKQDSS
jgi:hypothetical protein